MTSHSLIGFEVSTKTRLPPLAAAPLSSTCRLRVAFLQSSSTTDMDFFTSEEGKPALKGSQHDRKSKAKVCGRSNVLH